MANAQEWLDQNYDTNKDKKTTIRINGKNLTGSLKITGFNSLNIIEC
jgi:hypothetical protein